MTTAIMEQANAEDAAEAAGLLRRSDGGTHISARFGGACEVLHAIRSLANDVAPEEIET